ncbi:MAG TPA: hypothetical protein VE224_00805, partial [Pseudolabrys sp.]|nr:hypothetical protein [Pseudolabrys sp.]
VSNMVSTAATMLLANAAGAVVGPLLAPLVMDALGPRSLFLFTSVIEGALAIYVLYRTRVQPSLAPPEKTEFDIVATAPVGAVVTTETPDPDDPLVVVPEPYPPPESTDMPAAEAPEPEMPAPEAPAPETASAEIELLPPEDRRGGHAPG